jgi:hypothetical protein
MPLLRRQDPLQRGLAQAELVAEFIGVFAAVDEAVFELDATKDAGVNVGVVEGRVDRLSRGYCGRDGGSAGFASAGYALEEFSEEVDYVEV